MSTVAIALTSPAQAHAALMELWRTTIKPHATAGGTAILTFQTTNDYYRHQLRKAFHGHFLNHVSEHVRVWCPVQLRYVRRVPKVWKDYFRQFVVPTFEEVADEDGVLRTIERRRSTEELSDDEFSEFFMRCQAHAALDLGLTYEGDM